MPSKNTKKKLKQAQQNQRPQKEKEEAVLVQDVATENVEEKSSVLTEQIVAQEETKQENQQVEEKKENAKEDNKKDKKKKKKGEGRFKRKTKEVFSELKKVTWPTFGQVVKKTATVLVVVIAFGLALLGIDTVLELAYDAFFGSL